MAWPFTAATTGFGTANSSARPSELDQELLEVAAIALQDLRQIDAGGEDVAASGDDHRARV